MIQRSRPTGHHVFYPRVATPETGATLTLTAGLLRVIQRSSSHHRQVFATRHLEIIAEQDGPAFQSSLVPLDQSQDVFGWDPL